MNDTNLVNDVLKQKLVELFDKGEAGAVSAVNWLLAHAPDVAKQYLQWECAKSIFWIAAASFVMVGGYLYLAFRKLRSVDKPDGSEFIPLLLFTQIFCWFALILNVFHLVKVLVAPKLVLIDFVIGLIHK